MTNENKQSSATTGKFVKKYLSIFSRIFGSDNNALVDAVEAGNIGMTKSLFEKGADVNAKTRERLQIRTVEEEKERQEWLNEEMKQLCFESKNGCIENATILLEAGVNVDATDNNVHTALISEVVEENVPDGIPLHQAIYDGRYFKNFYDKNPKLSLLMIENHIQNPNLVKHKNLLKSLIDGNISLEEIEKYKKSAPFSLVTDSNKAFYRVMFVAMILTQFPKQEIKRELFEAFNISEEQFELIRQNIFPVVDESDANNILMRKEFLQSRAMYYDLYEKLVQKLQISPEDLSIFGKLYMLRSMLDIKNKKPALRSEFLKIIKRLPPFPATTNEINVENITAEACVVDIINDRPSTLFSQMQEFISKHNLSFSGILRAGVFINSVKIINDIYDSFADDLKLLQENLTIDLLKAAIDLDALDSLNYLLPLYKKLKIDVDTNFLLNYALRKGHLDIVKYLVEIHNVAPNYLDIILLEDITSIDFGIDIEKANRLYEQLNKLEQNTVGKSCAK